MLKYFLDLFILLEQIQKIGGSLYAKGKEVLGSNEILGISNIVYIFGDSV